MKNKLEELNDTDILKELEESRDEIRQLKFQFTVTRTLENPRAIRNLRKKVARLLTLQNQRKKKA